MSVLARYTTAAALARLADEGSRVALLLAALEHGRGPAFGGLLVGALMVPHVLAAPVIGAVADRVRHRRLLYVGCLLGYGAGLATGATLIGPAPVLAFVAVVLAGCLAPLLLGGLTSVLAEIVPGDPQRAFGLDATSYGAAGIAGPALAAVLAAATNAIGASIALAAACGLSAVLVATLPIPARERVERRGAGGALPVMWRRPALAAVTAGTALGQFGVGALPIVAALLAVRAGDPALTGVALSVMAAGNLVGALAYTPRPIRRWSPEAVVAVCLLLLTVPFGLLAVTGQRWVALGLFAVAGLLFGPMTTALFTVRDREAPPAVRTQVFTIGAGMKVTAGAAGAALGGLATGLGPGGLLLVVAASQLTAGLTAVALLRRPGPAGLPGTPSRAATPAPSGR
jgi:MFS family permease